MEKLVAVLLPVRKLLSAARVRMTQPLDQEGVVGSALIQNGPDGFPYTVIFLCSKSTVFGFARLVFLKNSRNLVLQEQGSDVIAVNLLDDLQEINAGVLVNLLMLGCSRRPKSGRR